MYSSTLKTLFSSSVAVSDHLEDSSSIAVADKCEHVATVAVADY